MGGESDTVSIMMDRRDMQSYLAEFWLEGTLNASPGGGLAVGFKRDATQSGTLDTFDSNIRILEATVKLASYREPI